MISRLALVSLLVAGCSPAAQPTPATPSSAAPKAVATEAISTVKTPGPAPRLAGTTYRVAAIDGQAPESTVEDEGGRRTARFGFVERSYGGTSGCNFMGGLYAQVGDRLYTMPGPQTQMACGGRLGAQERAIGAMFAASPTIVELGDGTVELRGGGHTLRMERDPGATKMDEVPTAWQGEALAGQSFVVRAVNGMPGVRIALDGWPAERLRFTDKTMTAAIDCPTPMVVPYRQGARVLEVTGVAATCSAVRDTALAAILAASPELVSGPNGELLIASRAGWVIAENERRDRPK